GACVAGRRRGAGRRGGVGGPAREGRRGAGLAASRRAAARRAAPRGAGRGRAAGGRWAAARRRRADRRVARCRRRTAAARRPRRQGQAAAAGALADARGDAGAARSVLPARAARSAAACAGANRSRGDGLRAAFGRCRAGAVAAGPAALACARDRAAVPARTLAGDLAPARSGGMSAVVALDRALRRVRRRAALDVLLAWLPLPLALAALLWRPAGPAPAVAVAALALLAVGIAAAYRLRRFDRRWLALRLDAARRDLDDSSALLFAEPAALSPLQRLQRERLEQRLRARAAPALRPPWSTRAIVFAWLALIATCLAVALWPAPRALPGGTPAPARDAPAAPEPRLLEQ